MSEIDRLASILAGPAIWPGLDERDRYGYRDGIRRVLKAMRDKAPGSLAKAGWTPVWQAMIDAVLAGEGD